MAAAAEEDHRESDANNMFADAHFEFDAGESPSGASDARRSRESGGRRDEIRAPPRPILPPVMGRGTSLPDLRGRSGSAPTPGRTTSRKRTPIYAADPVPAAPAAMQGRRVSSESTDTYVDISPSPVPGDGEDFDHQMDRADDRDFEKQMAKADSYDVEKLAWKSFQVGGMWVSFVDTA